MTQEAPELKNTESIKAKRDKRQFLTNAGKGRPKGVKNKATKNAQDIIQKAFDGLGGSKALIEWANKNEKNKGAFYTIIWPKIIPKNITVDATVTHDIATRLLEARKIQNQVELEAQKPKMIEITHHGQVISEKVIESSIVEEVESEDKVIINTTDHS